MKSEDIAGAVQTALSRDPGVDSDDIQVDVTRGIVELAGCRPSALLSNFTCVG
jgi:osmotically-inducible protein OsmY